MPDAPGLELIAHEVNARNEGAVVGSSFDHQRAVLLTTPDHVRDADPGEGALPQTHTVTDIFPTADFQEREVYDFFGIVFKGHPDLRRILMPEDYVGWPQRRDFPVGGEPVLFTYNEIEAPRWFE